MFNALREEKTESVVKDAAFAVLGSLALDDNAKGMIYSDWLVNECIKWIRAEKKASPMRETILVLLGTLSCDSATNQAAMFSESL